MDFIIGVMCGLMIATLLLIGLAYLRHPIESRVNIVSKAIQNIGPRPKGYIIEPDSEREEMRSSIIEKNKQLGRDTFAEELE